MQVRVGEWVHIDTDNKEWGRVASDGTVQAISANKALIQVFSIKASLWVSLADVSKPKLFDIPIRAKKP